MMQMDRVTEIQDRRFIERRRQLAGEPDNRFARANRVRLAELERELRHSDRLGIDAETVDQTMWAQPDYTIDPVTGVSQ